MSRAVKVVQASFHAVVFEVSHNFSQDAAALQAIWRGIDAIYEDLHERGAC